MIEKWNKEPKFSTRGYNRCKICGRPHAYLRDMLQRLPTHKVSQIGELLPHRWVPAVS